MWWMRTAESVVFTDWPPGPPERMTSIFKSLGSMLMSTSSSSGMMATVAVDVWMRARGLGAGPAVPPVHAGFVLEVGIGALPLDRGHDFLEPARRSAGHGQDLDLPATALGEARVHTKKVGREKRRFLAARAATNFEQDVLVVVGILGQQQELQPFFQARLLGRKLVLFLPRQIPHFGILLHFARLLDAGHGLPMDAQGVDQLADVRVLLGQLLHRSEERRVGKECRS